MNKESVGRGRMKLFGLFALAMAILLFVGDKDLRNSSGYFLMLFSVLFAVVLVLLFELLKSKRPDLYNKWFPESELEKKFQSAKGSDLKVVSVEFSKMIVSSPLWGILAGLIVVIFAFAFIWYAKTHLGW